MGLLSIHHPSRVSTPIPSVLPILNQSLASLRPSLLVPLPLPCPYPFVAPFPRLPVLPIAASAAKMAPIGGQALSKQRPFG